VIGSVCLADSSEELTRASDWRLKKCPDADSDNAAERLQRALINRRFARKSLFDDVPAVLKKNLRNIEGQFMSASMGGPARLCEDLAHEDEPVCMKTLQTLPPRSFPKVPDAASGESIFAEGAKKRIAKSSTSSQHNIAISLEGPIGTSKTESAKDIIARLAADPGRRRAFPLGEGHFWLLDETNMALQTVLQFMEAAIEGQQISIPMPGKCLQRPVMPPNFGLIGGEMEVREDLQ
jgi:hypothetical protein